MHERTQRALARLMFVLCCALPTLGTLFVILLTWTPWYHNRTRLALERFLSDETGLIVTIEDFDRTSPYLLKLHRVVMLEPETQREVVSFRMAEWATRNEDAALLVVHQPQIRSEQLAAFWNSIHDRFLCRPTRTEPRLRIVADDLTIESRSGRPYTFQRLDVKVQTHSRAVIANVSAVPADARDEAPIRMTLRRDRASAKPTTTWGLETGDTPLPCSAVADYSPLLKKLGPDAQFNGNIGWQFDDGIWRLNLASANFTDIDLSSLSETLTHSLSGKARVSFTRGYIDPGHEVDINGSIVVRNGLIGDSLMRSASQHLNFVVDERSLNGHKLPFDWVSLNFNILGPQLRLWGTCSGLPGYESLTNDAAICADGRSIASSSGTLLPSTQLAVAFAPNHSVSYPMSDQTSWIKHVLLPPSRPLPTDDAIQNARITRAAPWNGTPPIAQPKANDTPVSMNR